MAEEHSVFNQYDVRAKVGMFNLFEWATGERPWMIWRHDPDAGDGECYGSFKHRENAERIINRLDALERKAFAANTTPEDGGSEQ